MKMNTQELIEKIENLNKLYGERHYVAIDDVLNLVSQLDEPQKLVIPQFVSKWLEDCKEKKQSLYSALQDCDSVNNWLDIEGNEDLFARAWLDGYEVEKEAKYTVKVKATKQYLCNDELGPHFSPSFRSNFTRTNLEELGFGWVFDCEGIEIEEVEK